MSAADNRECEGRVALVTGASRGIGAAIAESLAEAGAKVAVTARTLEPVERYEGSLSETVDRIRSAGGEVVPIQADISKPDERRRMVDEAVAAFGPIDIKDWCHYAWSRGLEVHDLSVPRRFLMGQTYRPFCFYVGDEDPTSTGTDWISCRARRSCPAVS